MFGKSIGQGVRQESLFPSNGTRSIGINHAIWEICSTPIGQAINCFICFHYFLPHKYKQLHSHETDKNTCETDIIKNSPLYI